MYINSPIPILPVQNQNVLLEPVFKRNLPLVKEQLVELKQVHT